jgi:hypothetical protein
MRWVAAAMYGGLVAFAWAMAGARLGMLLLLCLLALTGLLGLGSAGDAIRGWAQFIYPPRALRSSSSSSSS